MVKIIPALYDIRSIYNVGSIMRTAEGLGIKKIYTIGLTPHLRQENDSRLPHVINRVENQIQKTALGAENNVENIHFEDFSQFQVYCNRQSLTILALEINPKSTDIYDFHLSNDSVLLLGPEVDGLKQEILEMTSKVLHIPMKGKKESFNVSVAAAIALSHLSRSI